MSSDDEGDHASPDPRRPSSRSESVHTPSASRHHVVPESTSPDEIPSPAGQKKYVQKTLCWITVRGNARPVANAMYAYHVQQSKNNAVVFKYPDGSHMGDDVMNAAKARGYRIALIPPGCTSVCQVHDLVVNKSFKAALRHQYALHLYHTRGDANRRLTMLEKRTQVMSWVASAYRRHDCGDPEHKPIEDSVRDSIYKHVWAAILAPPPAAAAEPEPAPPAAPPLSMEQVEGLRQQLVDFEIEGTDGTPPLEQVDARTMRMMGDREEVEGLEQKLTAASEEKVERLKAKPPKPAAKRAQRDPNTRVQRKPRSGGKKK